MWLALVAVAAGCGVGIAAGGRLVDLHWVRFQRPSFLAAGAACEAVADRWFAGDGGLGLVLAGYALMLAFAAANLRHPGSVLVAAGLLSNIAVIGVNAGMPVRGVTPGAELGGHHHGEKPGDRLIGLSDVMYVAPLGETLSAGDILLAGGVGTMTGFAVLAARKKTPEQEGTGSELTAGARP